MRDRPSRTKQPGVASGFLARAEQLAPLLLIILAWVAVSEGGLVPAWIIPPPALLGERLMRAYGSGALSNDIRTTLGEILSGVTIGSVAGIVLGVLFSRLPLLGRTMMPVVVIVQVVPKLAIAPLLILWLGLGVTSKIVLVAIVSAFPVLLGTLDGISRLPSTIKDLCDILDVRGAKRFLSIELPYSFPLIISGIRIGALHGVTAAVIGELLGAQAGLGYWATRAQASDDVSSLLVAVLLLSLIGCLINLALGNLESFVSRRFGGVR